MYIFDVCKIFSCIIFFLLLVFYEVYLVVPMLQCGFDIFGFFIALIGIFMFFLFYINNFVAYNKLCCSFLCFSIGVVLRMGKYMSLNNEFLFYSCHY
jgi:hypothetical protein